MKYLGIDIGSTTTKAVVMDCDGNIEKSVIMPTGCSAVETSEIIAKNLKDEGYERNDLKIVATGYGRVSAGFADQTKTEISCHGKGAYYLFKDKDCVIIDIGGQDVKIITLKNGAVSDFLMNDKCSAGTGRFLEVMANIMGITIENLCTLAENGKDTTISSMCTVFAESEVISLIGMGKSKEDISFAIVESITEKVKTLCNKHAKENQNVYLTGGLYKSPYILKSLSKKLEKQVKTNDMAQFAGAIGAALYAKKL